MIKKLSTFIFIGIAGSSLFAAGDVTFRQGSGGGTVTIQQGTSGGGSGGGSSALEVFSNFSGTRSSPTASIGLDSTMKMSVSGSTAIAGVALNLTVSTVTTNALYLKDTAGGSIKALVDYEDFGASGGEITLNMDNGTSGPEQLVIGSTDTNTKNIVFNGQNTGVMSFDDPTEVLNWNKKLSVDSDVTFGTTQGFQYDSTVSSVTVAGSIRSGAIMTAKGTGTMGLKVVSSVTGFGAGATIGLYSNDDEVTPNATFGYDSTNNYYGLKDSAGTRTFGLNRNTLTNKSAMEIYNYTASNFVSFRSSATTDTQNYVLPNSTGAAGTVLTIRSIQPAVGFNDAVALLAWTTPAGGGGSSSLAVGTGTASNFTNNITSPTAAVSFLGDQFRSVAGGTTNFVSLNLSSVTVQGVITAGSNIRLTPAAGTLTIAENFSYAFPLGQMKFGPSANAAIENSTNTIFSPLLLFDASSVEYATFTTTVNGAWGTPKLDVIYSMRSATSGTVDWVARLMCVTPGDAADVDSTSYAAVASSHSASVPATAGYSQKLTIAIADDSCADGDMIAVSVNRDAADGTNDTATGDAELRAVILRNE